MEFLKKATLANGKPKPFGFDTNADFIPFEFSDDEDGSKDVTDAEIESRGSIATTPRDSGSRYTGLPVAEGISSLTNGQGRKRKRDDEDEGPPSQRPKTGHFTMNPWQKDINGYTFSKEVARLYILPQAQVNGKFT